MAATTDFSIVSPVVDTVDPDVGDLVDRVRSLRGRQPVDEHRWARVGADAAQRLVVARDSSVAGFVLLTPAADGWELDMLVDPGRRDDGGLVDALVRTAVEEVAGRGGGPTQLWVHEATDTDAAAAERSGLHTRRDLHQLRVPLPIEADAEPIETRPFEIGRDEAAWLETNAAAFAAHPDQGHWTLEDLRQRQAEDWFDPEDFLIHDIVDEHGDVRLAGFNWTKHHRCGIGEIYVIGVHPDFAGRGLGRRLCVAGLDHLARRATTGMLYVDADNAPAMGLYESLGFTVDHTNTALIGTVV